MKRSWKRLGGWFERMMSAVTFAEAGEVEVARALVRAIDERAVRREAVRAPRGPAIGLVAPHPSHP